ncbi:DUF2057 family protein [Thalassotalea sp. 1_MG-2023]|uniref:DUF2057 family protein n=1 Tax=Thalassotalea sp. 1_MG-2023 TaxID=3062680 RepID=UPI0026E161EB|nr:DUF2057 family protein [Thalassotalea sp. 1_MG-2023]MDO6426914.1 DUF2057 family protein [Thalassotalea sp. 1_MG-2023]
MVKSFIANLTFLYLVSVHAIASEVKIPANIKVLQVNDTQFTANFFDRSTSHAIKIGLNELHLQFKELVEDVENDDHSTIYSEPFVVIFTLKTAKELTLLVPEFNSEAQVRAYAKKPNILLVDRTQRNINHTLYDVKDYTSRQSNQFDLTKENKSARLINQQHEKLPQTVTERNYSDSIHQFTDKMPLNMLHYWWHKASTEQKVEFLDNVNLESKKGK